MRHLPLAAALRSGSRRGRAQRRSAAKILAPSSPFPCLDLLCPREELAPTFSLRVVLYINLDSWDLFALDDFGPLDGCWTADESLHVQA